MLTSASRRFLHRSVTGNSSLALRNKVIARSFAATTPVVSIHSPRFMEFATLVEAGIIMAGALYLHNDMNTRLENDIIVAGTPVKEKATGILFPPLCNGYQLVGSGVRTKYGFVKVYAVGTYVDATSLFDVKTDEQIERALLDPMRPRTIRIVMNRDLAIDKYTAGIMESLLPRMNGQELEK
jgi:hypothetical protein